MNARDPVLIEAVVDRSGSMAHLTDDTIGGYNAWLAEQQNVKGEADLTLTLFDHEIKTENTVKIEDAKPLDGERYVARGSTVLNDAIGRAIGRLEAKNPTKAILMILTDGFENASKEFTTSQIKAQIERIQKDKGWQVVYLSADAEAFAHGQMLGVLRSNTVQFAATGAGVRSAYTASACLNTNYRNAPVNPGEGENK